jgi:hypothetical protein
MTAGDRHGLPAQDLLCTHGRSEGEHRLPRRTFYRRLKEYGILD